jgi:accessory colonization factor AcfA
MKKLALASAIGLMVSAPAFAGPYVAVDLGRASFGDDLNTACTQIAGATSCKKTDTAFRLSVGHNLTDNFGVEVSYGDYGKTSAASATQNATVKASALQVVGTGRLPVTDKITLTAKAGAAFVNAKSTATGFAAPVLASASVNKTNLVWGVGAEYALTPTVSLRGGIEDLGTVGNTTTAGSYKLTNVYAGAVFNF